MFTVIQRILDKQAIEYMLVTISIRRSRSEVNFPKSSRGYIVRRIYILVDLII